jgi:hypothetical protein
MTDPASLQIHPTAFVSADARIQPSVRGTRIVIGAHTQIYDFVVISAVGGSGDDYRRALPHQSRLRPLLSPPHHDG